MKIVTFGSGGVGGYFGGRLAHNGQDVTFVARGAHLAAMRNSGLHVESIGGDFTVQPVEAVEKASDIVAADLVIIATKAWQLDEAIPQIQPLIGEKTVILPLLNGMEHMDKLLARFQSSQVLGGLCRISVFIEAPGHIRHVGIQPYIAFGELDHSKSQRVEAIRKMFSALDGILVEVPEDIHVTMWEKFVFISGTSGVGAYTRQPIGAYRDDPEARQMLIDAMNETAAVAGARGVMLSRSLVADTMKRIDNLPYAMLASMQKDMMEGRPSELHEQTGAVIRLGKAVGVPTPTHQKLFEALSPLEIKARL